MWTSLKQLLWKKFNIRDVYKDLPIHLTSIISCKYKYCKNLVFANQQNNITGFTFIANLSTLFL